MEKEARVKELMRLHEESRRYLDDLQRNMSLRAELIRDILRDKQLSVAEIAEMLGVQPSRVYTMKNQDIPKPPKPKEEEKEEEQS